ncbi:MAG: helix-turn-helix transcriptional regulator [Microvirga sp.]
MHAVASQAHLGPGFSPVGSHEQCGATHRPAPVAAALKAFVDHLEQGVAVADRYGRALFLNRAGQAIVRGSHLRLANGRLCANAPSGSMALHKLIADCAATGSEGWLRLGSEEDTLLIAVNTFPPAGDADADPIVLLRLIDPVTARPSAKKALQTQFGLTPAEAALALDILAGNDLAACAARRGITLNTARAHLRRLFEKTETRRQAALMRLLLLCPKPIADHSAPAAGSTLEPKRDGRDERICYRHGAA